MLKDHDKDTVDVGGANEHHEQQPTRSQLMQLLADDTDSDEEGNLMIDVDSKRRSSKDRTVPKGGHNNKAKEQNDGKHKDLLFNAYMLWAKHERRHVLEQHPEMNLVDSNKHMGQMWNSLEINEKDYWKQKAANLPTNLTSKLHQIQTGVVK